MLWSKLKKMWAIKYFSLPANRKAQLTEISVVWTLSWLPNFCGFHPLVVTTLLSFPPSCGLHLVMVTKLSWFWPCCGYHTFVISTLPWLPNFRGFHPVMVTKLSWFPPSHRYQTFVVSTLSWLLRGVHPGFWLKLAWKWQFLWLLSVVSTSRGYSMVSTLLWCPPFRGFHPPMVSNLLWLLRGVHPGFWLKLAWKW